MADTKRPAEGEPEVRLPDLEKPENRYEHADVNAWAVGKFGIALALLCGVALLLLVGLFKYFMSQEAPAPARTAAINVDARRLPPEPRLQVAPTLDLDQMRAAEDKILGSYGWVDRQNGLVRIPIARAMDVLAQRGLPARTTPPPPAAATVPTESGLGYIVQQPGGPLAGNHAPPEPPAPPVESSKPLGKALPNADQGEKRK